MSGCLTIAVVTLPWLMKCQQNECDARRGNSKSCGTPHGMGRCGRCITLIGMGRRWQRVEGGAGGTWHFNCWNECRDNEKNCELSAFRDKKIWWSKCSLRKGTSLAFCPKN